MIALVRGEVAAVELDHAVVDVGGVGLAVYATPSTLATLRRGEQTRLATSLVVREESLTLYGFVDATARELFVLLQTVSGVGPRLALAMLAVLEPSVLCAAIAEGNLAALTKVPGIGRKGAERLVIELRDKVGSVRSGPTPMPVIAGTDQVRAQVTEALIGLGFASRAAEQAVEAVLADDDASTPDTARLLRSALTRLGRSR